MSARNHSLRVLLAVVAGLALGSCGAGEGELVEAEFVDEEARAADELKGGKAFKATDLKEGELVRENGIGGFVPGAGERVALTIDHLDGKKELVEIANDGAGQVRVRHEVMEPDAAPIDLGSELGRFEQHLSPAACSDGTYKLMGFKWTKAWAWAFKSSLVPSGNTVSAVESSLKLAVNNITSSRNSCGLSDYVTATSSYLGRTTTPTQIVSNSSSVQCGTGDRKNVVAFGTLPSNYLGVACTYWIGSTAVEADVKINSYYHKWFAGRTVPATCSNRYSIEGVTTHEVGHVFGLNDLSYTYHANLTMAGAMRPCTLMSTTLGLGDVKGLRSLY